MANNNIEYFNNELFPLNNGYNGLIKATLAEQAELFNNPTARRVLGNDNRTYVGKPGELGEEGGEVGNVYLSSVDNYVVPGILDINGELQFVPLDLFYTPENEHRTDTLSFKMRTNEEADYFAKNYKKVVGFNPMFRGEYSPIQQVTPTNTELSVGIDPNILLEVNNYPELLETTPKDTKVGTSLASPPFPSLLDYIKANTSPFYSETPPYIPREESFMNRHGPKTTNNIILAYKQDLPEVKPLKGNPNIVTFDDKESLLKNYSIADKALEIRLKVAERYKPLYNYLENNLFAKGGNKKGGKSAFDTSMERTLTDPKWSKYNNKETRAFLKAIASQESSFVPTAKSVAGALGYFLLMPYEGVNKLTDQQKASGNWDLFGLMLLHMDANEKEINRRFTKGDWDKASALGLNMYDLLAVAHFSGVGGLRRWLHRSTPKNFNNGAKDAYGMSLLGYLNKFRKGMLSYGATIPNTTLLPIVQPQEQLLQLEYPNLDDMLTQLNNLYAQAYLPVTTYGTLATNQNNYRIALIDNPLENVINLQSSLIGNNVINRYDLWGGGEGKSNLSNQLYRSYNGYAPDLPPRQ